MLFPDEPFKDHKQFDPHTHFASIVGVTRNIGERPVNVEFWANPEQAPYIRTKPIHASQQLLEETTAGMRFRITVVPNFELERELLGFGDGLKVLSPARLVRRLRTRIQKMAALYPRDDT